MLFLLKRKVRTSLLALLVLGLLGLALRQVAPGPLPELAFTPKAAWTGLVIVSVVLLSDGMVHGLLTLGFGRRYLLLYGELAWAFRRQRVAAMLTGALMAGVGEELFFRGATMSLPILLAGGVAFGVCHHLPGRLAPFTFWSIWEGLLFALALWWTQLLTATMLAHFLHDLVGFLLFRWQNRRGQV
jgi:membrane protease YdiL (CAAX protease family)